jgi:hypothetical protein
MAQCNGIYKSMIWAKPGITIIWRAGTGYSWDIEEIQQIINSILGL